MKRNYPPNFTYQDFARDFTAEFFEPEKWADLFAESGARYVVLTSKHHEGYTLWPSKNSFSWNAKDMGPKRDLVGGLATAVRTRHPHLKFGLYHSLYEWFNPLYLQDKANNFNTCDFVRMKAMPELYDLVLNYEPEVLWSDGDWEAPDSYWESKPFLAWLYNDSPVRGTVVTNDRWGKDTLCKHGDFYTCADRYSPGVLQSHKWENCLTIDRRSWGFRRNAPLSDYMTIEELIEELVKTVSCGGNMLMNVGPTKDGIITPIYEERLRQMGKWLRTNGEAIYGSRPWTCQNDTLTQRVWYTKNGKSIYASVLFWPDDDYLMLGCPRLPATSNVYLLGYNAETLPWEIVDGNLRIKLPKLNRVESEWAYVFKISNVLN
ncbi:UNVERIFIED_CONTAM: hypothetical protein PYX00_001366 [Menopon gallinae]|uniref:Putative alpha-L-fucosidase n=1 Tax=Menopon gallinae TaxID=328185 RepID=A0AAW2IEJ7_9NEOP